MEILLSREQSSMASTWNEMIAAFREESGDWVLGNCGYEIIGSIYDYLSEEELNSEDGPRIPEQINGIKVHGIADGEYIESDQIIFYDETVIFSKDTFQSAIDYFENYNWNTHPDYDLAIAKLRIKVFSQDIN